jgi:hypothetical protein
MSTFEALQILIFLIPGFISAILLDKIMGREKKERDLAIFVEALILSFIIYVIYSLFYDSSPVYFDEQKKTAVVKSWWALGLILLCSFLLPAFFSFLHHSGIYMRLFRKMRVTSYTGGRDTWEEIFKTKYRSIIVNFEDGHRLQGWAEYVAGTYDAISIKHALRALSMPSLALLVDVGDHHAGHLIGVRGNPHLPNPISFPARRRAACGTWSPPRWGRSRRTRCKHPRPQNTGRWRWPFRSSTPARARPPAGRRCSHPGRRF